ncbi:DUF2975 domain-containing protein [uncultured Sphingomonas sp.]|uniref:DUF2975 domain-containing protein n=1 Tax=uncultured Sphingomonas sp. TaxID=158754 RepID=UPI0035CBA81E
MGRDDRVLRMCQGVLRTLNGLNWVFVVVSAVALILTMALAGPLSAHLAHKYQSQPVEPIVIGLRLLLLLGIAVGCPAHLIFTRLLGVIATVRAGDPFTIANAQRLRVIGWALLAMQLLDLLAGLLNGWMTLRHIDTIGWQPSIGGWIAVPMPFVLARVFAIGVEMRAEIEATI